MLGIRKWDGATVIGETHDNGKNQIFNHFAFSHPGSVINGLAGSGPLKSEIFKLSDEGASIVEEGEN